MKTLIHRNVGSLEHRRFEAIRLFKRHEAQSDIARKLSVSRQAVSVWIHRHSKNGKDALKATTASGRPPKIIFSEISAELKRILKKGARLFLRQSPGVK